MTEPTDPRLLEILAVTVQATKFQFDYAVQCIENGRWLYAIPALHELQRGANGLLEMLGRLGMSENPSLSDEEAGVIKSTFLSEMNQKVEAAHLSERMKKVVGQTLAEALGIDMDALFGGVS